MKPAARLGDMHTCPMVTPGLPPIPHVGGPIMPPCYPPVIIGNMPAARVTDMCICVGPPDVIVQGSPTVFIGNMPAARIGDLTAHGGVIVQGWPTVLIGDFGGGPPGVGVPPVPGHDGGIIDQIVDTVKEVYDKVVGGALKSADDKKAARQAGGKKVFPGKQEFENCGVQSVGQLIAAKTGKKPDEEALLREAILDGNAEDHNENKSKRDKIEDADFGDNAGGTVAEDRRKILKKHGIDSSIKDTNKENLADAINGNKGIVVNVDAGELWNDPQYAGGGHAIVVYDGDFDENGNLTHVYVNDTGANQQGRKMSIDDFMAAANKKKPKSQMNVTDDAIW